MTLHFPQRAPIDSFGAGGFRFAHLSHRGSLLVLPSGMYNWNVSSFDLAVPQDFATLVAEREQFDWLLLGTGQTMARPTRPLVEFFAANTISWEFMTTAAAVRTYNVVLAEGRRVAAAIIAVSGTA